MPLVKVCTEGGLPRKKQSQRSTLAYSILSSTILELIAEAN